MERNLLKKIAIWIFLGWQSLLIAQGNQSIRLKYIIEDQSLIQKKSFFQKVFGWITGEDAIRLVKPYDAVLFHEREGWILDQGTGLIIRIKGEEITPVDMKNLSVPSLPSPVDISPGPDGNLLVTDSFLNTVFILDTLKNELKPFIRNSGFKRITGVAYAKSTKRIYIVDTGKHSVYIYTDKGQFSSEFGARGKEPGQFNFPTFVAVDNQGNVYIVDSMNFRVQVFTSDGKYRYHFGEPGDKPGFFGRPKQIAVDEDGHLFIVDVYFQAVQVFDNLGNWLTTFGGFGEEKGRFWLPGGIFVNQMKEIVVSDTYNRRIQVFQVLNGGKSK